MPDDKNPFHRAQYAVLAVVIFIAVFLAIIAGAAVVMVAGF